MSGPFRRINFTLFSTTLPLLLCASLATAQRSHVEDFTTTDFMDTAATTALWDDAAGELRLEALPRLVGSFDTSGDARDVQVDGNIAYVADLGGGLQIIDVANLYAPVLLASLATPDAARALAVDGNLVYVAAGSSGVQVIDVSDPQNPAIIGSIDTGDNTTDVDIAGDVAYVTDNVAGFVSIDVSDPTNPVELGSHIFSPSGQSVTVAGDVAYISRSGAGLRSLDVSDPAVIVPLGNAATGNSSLDIAISGDLAFVADGTAGLRIINIHDPSSPVLAGVLDTPSVARGVSVAGNTAYVSDGSSGVHLIDVSDPSVPVLFRTADTPGNAWKLQVEGGVVFVADGTAGLQILRDMSWRQPTVVGEMGLPTWLRGLCLAGRTLFTLDSNALHAIDLSDPTAPAMIGSIAIDGSDVHVAGDIAYVGGPAALNAVDITDPSSMSSLGSLAASAAVAWDLAGNVAFAAGPRAFDITDPTSMALLMDMSWADADLSVSVRGNLLYQLVWSTVPTGQLLLEAYDISNPLSPVGAGSLQLSSGNVLVVDGSLAYITGEGGSGVQVVDIRAGLSPLGFMSTTSPLDLYVDGDYGYVADGAGGLLLADLSDPLAPVALSAGGPPAGYVTAAGEHAFVVGADSLHVLRVLQSAFDTNQNLAASTDVYDGGDDVFRVRLTTTQASQIDWEVTADGSTWEPMVTDGSWHFPSSSGNDLRWRSRHLVVDDAVNPSCTALQLDWLTESAWIEAVEDVPNDQGGWLRLKFVRSGHDFADETSLPITGYQALQRIDDGALKNAVVSLGTRTESEARLGSQAILQHEGREFVLGASASRSGKSANQLPSGVWEIVGSVLPMQQDDYSVRIPSLTDSSLAGEGWSVLVVTAHTATPSIWYCSEPDSGYSVDNIAPGVPQSIVASYSGGGVDLSWDATAEQDLQFYRVYRDSDPNFVPSQSTLVHETATTGWTDATPNPWGLHYRVSAVDDAGNEGESGQPAGLTATQERIPLRFSVGGPFPNPFNPSTSILFSLPGQTRVRLTIYDLAGRVVRTLLDEVREAGEYRARWDGRDAHGRGVASGVYHFRLEAGMLEATKRAVLVK